MEPPLMPSDFAYGSTDRPGWLTTSSADDITLPAPSADDLTRNDWTEWMQWDPAAASQSQDAKPLNVQGPLCFLRPDQRPSIFNRRQNSQSRDASLGLPSATIPTSAPLAPPMTNVPYTFGGDMEPPPAFDFDGNTLSSPSSGGGQQQNGFYSPPMWEQQPQSGDRTMFSPQPFSQPGMTNAPAPAPPMSTPSLQHSPSSLNNGRTSSSSTQSSPEPASKNPKKRKPPSEEADKGPATKKDKGAPVKKTAHNMIEKRYRTNLNDKIAALRDSVPSLRCMSRPNGGNEEDDDPEDLEGLTPAHKLNKATVLSKATEYIRHLEKRQNVLQNEVKSLKDRLESYEKTAISGPMALHGHVGTPDGNRYHDDPFGHQSTMQSSGPPQGMIPVPESMASLHRGLPPQPHFAPQASYPAYSNAPGRPGLPGPPLVNGRRSSAMMGKLMVGSLAGLMILEGFTEREQSQEEPAGRGLYALPFDFASILAPRVSLGAASTQIPLAKLLLVFGAVFYIIAPLLDFRSKPKKKTTPAIFLARAPSLASPVEVRRKAWLTAIQTVWVPRHNFLLEVAALALKTLKLSTRKIIGWPGYAYVTGITKEQEAARVKAWLIALDAQLTGGDAEISKSRLVLTLMASGTLPDTPALLMLKALHIRVLLWELANVGYGGWRLFDRLSAKLARRYWNAARSEHRIAANLASRPGSDAEPLPAHLAALVEMDCDQVLIPLIIQRAYNLAWNKPSAENTTLEKSMDSVVEDFAIASPLDALAAWWSSFASRKALAGCLATKTCVANDKVKEALELAVQTAPPTSQAQLRALTAQAVLLDEDRSARLTAALDALPSPPGLHFKKPAQILNPLGDNSVSSDIRKALTLAKCLQLVQWPSPQGQQRAISVVNNTLIQESSTTLLSFVAAYKVLQYFIQDPLVQSESSRGLEHLASALRLWVGHEIGRRSGLSTKIRTRVVEQCLDASKLLVGLAEPEYIDDGYVSSSVKDE